MENESSLHTQLQNLLVSKQWDRAKDVIYELLTHQPDSSWLHEKMGNVLSELNDYSNAEIHLKKSITYDPSYSEAHSSLAWLYFKMGRTGTADDANKIALSLEPDDLNAHILAIHIALIYDNIALAENHLNVIENSLIDSSTISELRTAILSHPKHKARINHQEQIEAHIKALALNPEKAYIHYQLAELYAEHTKQYHEAENHIKLALQIEPYDKDYQRLYAKIIRKKNPIIRILSLPLRPFEDVAKQDEHMTLYLVAGMMLIAILGSTLPPQHQPTLKLAVLFIISLYVVIYPVIKLYEYLTLTELYHKMQKIQVFKGPMKRLHQLPYPTRFCIFAIITLVFWAALSMLIIKYYPL